jgi:tRNA (guanine37-N1)-methyltransferase
VQFGIVTLFPDAVTGFAELGVTGRAMSSGAVGVSVHNPREFCVDVHRTVDDRPYGGGPGMVMKCAPLAAAIDAAQAALPAGSPVVMMSPQGRRFDQQRARECASWSGVVLVAGRYEGIDERLIAEKVDQEWSLGDFVLSGGELAALVVMDAVTRLLPEVLGDPASAEQDSFMDGLLDHPHYTRPAEWHGRAVPAELLSGDHAAIRRWRLKQALGRTWQRRPDLLAGRSLSDEERALLDEFRAETDG